MNYVIQLAGGLTEQQFAQNPRQSFRERNYYSPQITIPALVFQSEISPKTTFNLKSYFLLGERNSVAFIVSPTVADSINTKLGTHNPRQVDRDFYKTFTTDIRILHRYKLFGGEHVLTSGYKFSQAFTNRKQFGKGNVNSDYDVSLTEPYYGIDLLFHTVNNGIFVENLFQINSRWTVTPGLRFDNISSEMSGDLPKFKLSNKRFDIIRNVFMSGIGSEYKLGKNSEIFINYSNAYHPVLHADLIPSATLMEVDPNLKDSKGYNFDFGFRGKFRDIFRIDISYFQLFYGNRIGNLTMLNTAGNQYIYRTNIGNALNKGIEALIDMNVFNLFERLQKNDLNVFCAYALNHARYENGSVIVGKENLNIAGNKVEDVPDYILRTGIKFKSNHFLLSFIYSQTGQMVSDANNTSFSSSGITGIIPTFHIMDATLGYQFPKRYNFTFSINNLENNLYFNRRVNNYLGPGILPASGRSVAASLGMKF